MTTKSVDLSKLFEEQRELSDRQVRISQELALVNQKILYVLATGVPRTNGTGSVSTAPEVKGGNGKVGARKRRAWFERGESLRLIRRAAKRAMRPAQVVHAVMQAKGYSDSLSGADRKRAESTIHQAIIVAVKSGKLARSNDGLVRAQA